jgi:hypothetical protein
MPSKFNPGVGDGELKKADGDLSSPFTTHANDGSVHALGPAVVRPFMVLVKEYCFTYISGCDILALGILTY